MGFVGCLEKPPNTPSTLKKTSKKDVLCLTIDEKIKSPKQDATDRMISLNDASLHRTDHSDKFNTPKRENNTFVKQSSWGYIDLFLDSENISDENIQDGTIKSPIARKTMRLDSKKKSAEQKEPVTSDKDQVMAHTMESLCRKHQSPVRRLVRTLSLTSTRSILTSPRHRTPLRSRLLHNKIDDETKTQGKGCSQRVLRRSGSLRLCATETGAVDTSTPEAVLWQMSVSPRRTSNVKKHYSDNGLVSPKPAQAVVLTSLSSPVKSTSHQKMAESIASARNSMPREAEESKIDVKEASFDPKTWNDLIIEFDNIADHRLMLNSS